VIGDRRQSQARSTLKGTSQRHRDKRINLALYRHWADRRRVDHEPSHQKEMDVWFVRIRHWRQSAAKPTAHHGVRGLGTRRVEVTDAEDLEPASIRSGRP
jgi:hypothetical protein